VTSLKQRIEDREGIPCSESRLIFNGKELVDGRSLVSEGIENESSISMVLRLLGGGKKKKGKKKKKKDDEPTERSLCLRPFTLTLTLTLT